MSKSDFIVFGSPLIGEEEIEELIKCVRSGWLGTGPLVNRFENDFAEYKEIGNAVAVNSCTAALHLSLIALNLGKNAEVITTPLTFCATVNAIIHAGYTPVLADVDAKTWNIDPKEIEKKITPRTKAILPVHFAGRPCDMDSIMKIAKKYKLKVIEDCAHAVETEYRGQKIGTFGDYGCFSFYSTKNVVTGEGGMVISKNNVKRIRELSLHGMNNDAWKRFGDSRFKQYDVTECGYKYNMMDMQASLGIHQLNKVNDNWNKRQKIWKKYINSLVNLPVTIPAKEESNTKHAYHLFNILIDEDKAGITRDSFLEKMVNNGIGVGIHYQALPEHTYYKSEFGWNIDDYPNAKRIGRQTVSLPLSAKLSDIDVNRIIKEVKNALQI
jgi:dTDP-4-amino-4,6-dideoxygalactose transaminase